TADDGLNLGGWQLDDVCIVANVNSVCGDGIKTPTEGCDAGNDNADVPDTCRTYCQLPSCGDDIVDEGEQCDRGLQGDGSCTPMCTSKVVPELGGCCSTGGGPAGSFALGAIVGGLFLVGGHRRRRRTRR
ncbi:MAG: DUF4215 domain-containing protein, partial [Polyangiales bacterium]